MSDELRPGEVTADVPPAADASIRFVGRIRTPFRTRADCPRQGDPEGPICRIEVEPPWDRALDGIEAYEVIEVVYWLHKARRDLLQQSPKSDGQTRGTFSLRSPVRPNPIGLSRVRLVARRGNVLEVRGLDCLDGTPLIDLKPDRCAYTVQAPPK